MRFKIRFKLMGDAPFSIPANYQSEISLWIHKMLHFQNNHFTQWLSQNKYLNNRGEFTLYTFSDVFNGAHKSQDNLVIDDTKAEMIIAFYAPEDIEQYVLTIFNNQEFKLGESRSKVAIRVEEVIPVDMPDFQQNQKTKFTCLSPMLISAPGNPNTEVFISPDQKDFDKVFFKSLMFKYANLVKFMSSGSANGLSSLNDLQFRLINKPKARIIKIRTDTPHQKAVKGFIFDFELKAPVELLKIGYNAGFGDLNNLGFGCCEIKM
jgi:CRISPR-associated endoribonuclease Cas6